MHRAVRHGMHMYNKARHYGSMVDRGVRTAAAIYARAIQPALVDAGVDVRKADKMLKSGYDHYNMYADNIQKGVDVVDNIAAHLRGGSFSYR
jgi:hypothetical protein